MGAAMDAANLENTRAALHAAVVKCSERCLYNSSKWAAELLTSMEDDPDFDDDTQMDTPTTPIPIVISTNADPTEAALEAKEINKYLLAKSFFDCREYDRCAAVFLPDTLLTSVITTSSNMQEAQIPKDKGKGKSTRLSLVTPPKAEIGARLLKLSQKSIFLALYAKMLAGEKRRDEDIEMVMGPHDSGKTVNRELVKISRFLHNWFKEREQNEDGSCADSQGWLEYLYGVVLSKEKNEKDALEYLIKSVKLFPMNWGCWLEISKLIGNQNEMTAVAKRLPENIMSFLFIVHTNLDLYQSSPHLLDQVHTLLSYFPTSVYLLTALAMLHYHAKDFSSAEAQFSSILAQHPYCLDSLDHYSNILYVMGLRPKLSFLAHLCSSIDKFRPETCVVIGNYYSLISHHEKAVTYFRRALTLDRSCLSAWTLMGHEYVELKNTHAAIESYRRAVDVNRRDYRAWYGLGQTYEVLEMHAYALYYYKRAAGLRPWDGKMWNAVGNCLGRMGKEAEGIKALKRALAADEGFDPTATGPRRRVMDTDIVLQIAGMYERLNDDDQAREWMELCVAQESEGTSDPEEDQEGFPGFGLDEGRAPNVTTSSSKARMWLARWSMRNGEWEAALRYAQELCHDGVEVEEAKALVRELRARGVERVRSDPLTEGLLSSP